MHISFVAATAFELLPLREFLEQKFRKKQENWYSYAGLNVEMIITGVGMTATAFTLGRRLLQQPPNLLINGGIAGSFNQEWALGTVVQVISEQFGDLGAEDSSGALLDLFDLGLATADEMPFKGGSLLNSGGADFDFLPKAKGLTVNKVHGSIHSIRMIREKYQVDIETMEGAAFFWAAIQEEIPFLQIRALSNYVEARNRENWQIALAIDRLNEVLIQIVESYRQLQSAP